MVPHEYKETLIKINIEKSDDTIKAAELLLNNNLIKDALNRIYYSVFYIVSALARKHDFITSKHSSMMGWFNKEFIYESKVFDKEMLDIYQELFKYRQLGDYDEVYKPDLVKTKELFEKAKIFIATVRKEI